MLFCISSSSSYNSSSLDSENQEFLIGNCTSEDPDTLQQIFSLQHGMFNAHRSCGMDGPLAC